MSILSEYGLWILDSGLTHTHLLFSGIIAFLLITTKVKKSSAASALLTPGYCFYFAMLCLVCEPNNRKKENIWVILFQVSSLIWILIFWKALIWICLCQSVIVTCNQVGREDVVNMLFAVKEWNLSIQFAKWFISDFRIGP